MDLRQLIQLKQQGISNRDAAHLLKIHRNTVNAYVSLFLSTDKPYSEWLGLDNTSLQELFPSPELKDQKRYDQLLSFLQQVDQDRHRRGFTFYRKWTEYRDLYPDCYGHIPVGIVIKMVSTDFVCVISFKKFQIHNY